MLSLGVSGHTSTLIPQAQTSHLSSKSSLHIFTQMAHRSLNSIFSLFLQPVPSTVHYHFTCHLHSCLSQRGDISLDSSFFLSLLIQPSNPINSSSYNPPTPTPQCSLPMPEDRLPSSSLPWITYKILQTVLPTFSVAPTPKTLFKLQVHSEVQVQ